MGEVIKELGLNFKAYKNGSIGAVVRELPCYDITHITY